VKPDSGSVLYHGQDLHDSFESLKHDIAAVPQREAIHCTLTARQAAEVSAHLPLDGTGAFATLRATVQRGLRLALRWLINPIVEQQNRANHAIHAALAALMQHDDAVRASMAARRATRRPRP
jgi:ABC-type cobalamin/Fe3+-siderophores transport system ATPase subunit